MMAVTPFLQKYHNESFTGILKWQRLDEFWVHLRTMASMGWYIYAIGEEPPQDKVEVDGFLTFIDEINKLLRRDHKEDYCGIVYVDNFDNPDMIKIFDPNNLGSSCGSSANPPPPGWILSKIQPQKIETNVIVANSRKRWWKKFFG